MSSTPSSRWSFGGPPTASELVVGVLAAATVLSGLTIAATVAWGWILAGVLPTGPSP